MEKKIRYFGISFRSRQHLDWFKCSVVIFLACFALFVFHFSIGKELGDQRILKVLCICISGIYGIALLMALRMTRGKEKNSSEEFSVDCIWFNGAMMIVYIVPLIILL